MGRGPRADGRRGGRPIVSAEHEHLAGLLALDARCWSDRRDRLLRTLIEGRDLLHDERRVADACSAASRAGRGLGGTCISRTTCMRRGAPVPIDFTRIGSFASLGSKGWTNARAEISVVLPTKGDSSSTRSSIFGWAACCRHGRNDLMRASCSRWLLLTLQLRHSASLFGPLLRPCGSGSSWQRWLSVRSL